MKSLLVVILALGFGTITSAVVEVRLPKKETAYVVTAPRTKLDRRVTEQLQGYLEKVLNSKVLVVEKLASVPANKPALILARYGEVNTLNSPAPPDSPEGYSLTTTKHGNRNIVVALGRTDRGLKRAVYRLILESKQQADALSIPDLKLSEKPWVLEREYALVPWVPQHVRGVFMNPHADNRMSIWLYSNDQIAGYVDMYDRFGFSGAQLMETAYSYAVFGSPEAFQEKQKTFANFIKENGQNVSLWVWAAEFNGFGWIDPDIKYKPRPGMSAFDDPEVRKGFEKYYDHYAKLAPYVDRLIGHFYDPGHIEDQQDVFKYMRLLEQKFKAKNPNIKMGIDSWAAGPDYLQKLVDNGFKDYLLLQMSMPHLFKPGQREQFHQEAKRLGIDVGIWGWYTTEYETDQLVGLHVNGGVLKEFYSQVQNGVDKIHPVSYWSEMEGHHLNNIYTMYISSQLMWDPNRDPRAILNELTQGIWGPQNGPKVLDALKLIEDVRSGPNWNTFWWTMPGYRLGTSSPAEDARRAAKAIQDLETMKPDPGYVSKFPLPVSDMTLIELMLPHLRQIHQFAQFRITLDGIRESMKSGASKEEISRRLSAAWVPIKEYNTWIGTFGQPERRMQEILIQKLAQEAGVKIDSPAWLRAQEADRLLQKLQFMQRATRGELQFTVKQLGEFMWTKEKLDDRFGKLIADGLVEKVGAETYRLTNWDQYAR